MLNGLHRRKSEWRARNVMVITALLGCIAPGGDTADARGGAAATGVWASASGAREAGAGAGAWTGARGTGADAGAGAGAWVGARGTGTGASGGAAGARGTGTGAWVGAAGLEGVECAADGAVDADERRVD